MAYDGVQLVLLDALLDKMDLVMWKLFEPGANTDFNTNKLKNASSDGAQNVQIQLLNNDGTTAIQLGKRFFVGQDVHSEAINSDDEATLRYMAQYYATGKAIVGMSFLVLITLLPMRVINNNRAFYYHYLQGSSSTAVRKSMKKFFFMMAGLFSVSSYANVGYLSYLSWKLGRY